VIDRAEVMSVRQRLKHAWVSFFARYGRLTPIQVKAIPKVLDGASVVLASPTASGKTEAVIAPVAERFVAEGWGDLAVLYVVPTRALANDTLARIQGPLADMGITAALKHGDRPYLPKKLPGLLITTPESLDSLICRRPGAFATLRTVILDEIHLLDCTYRGDQLRVLLPRLRELGPSQGFSVHLLSATLADPQGIAQRYAHNAKVITVAGQRSIDYCLVGSLREVHALARQKGWRKLLCFCNMRESVETVAGELAQLWRPYPVVAHHGSLSREVRDEAETVMREAGVAVCVATSTLEIGVDIGDIDLIVLGEVPWSISALLQRIGRGNRRDDVIRVAALAASEAERGLLTAMFELAKSGALPAQRYQPNLSVVVQQVFSCLYQHLEGMTGGALEALVAPLCSQDEARLIIEHLRRQEWVEWAAGRWYASTRLRDMGERGLIHSNIPDSKRYRVVDVDSGAEIGTVMGVSDDVFALARRTWRVVSIAGDMIRARQFKGKASAPLFKKHRGAGAFHRYLPPELKARQDDLGTSDDALSR